MRAARLKELEEMLAKLLETARKLPSGQDHHNALHEIERFRLKAEIMVDHFHDHVIAPGKIGGQARAMVVTGGVARAIEYFHAIKTYLGERKSPYQPVIAFSGEHEYNGAKI